MDSRAYSRRNRGFTGPLVDIGLRQVEGFDIRGATDAFAVLGGIRLPAFVESILLQRQIVPALVPVRLVSLDLATGDITERVLIGTGSPLVGFTIDIPAPPAP